MRRFLKMAHNSAPDAFATGADWLVDAPEPAESWSRKALARRGLRRSHTDLTPFPTPIVSVSLPGADRRYLSIHHESRLAQLIPTVGTDDCCCAARDWFRAKRSRAPFAPQARLSRRPLRPARGELGEPKDHVFREHLAFRGKELLVSARGLLGSAAGRDLLWSGRGWKRGRGLRLRFCR
jgi:hypothetical protein